MLAEQNLIKPMLAIEHNKVNLDLSHGYYASAKLDGIRCLVLDGIAYSRRMKPIRNKCIQAFVRANKEVLNGMDGELIAGEATAENAFRDSTSVVMSEDGGEDFTFYIFDNILLKDEYYAQRYLAIKAKLQHFNNPKAQLVQHELIHSSEQLEELENKYLEQGYEGIMLNFRKGYYKQGRSATKNPELIKKKLFSDSEFKVVGYDCLYSNQNEAKKDNLGHTERSTHKEGLVPQEKLGSLKLVTADGVEFSCGSGFDAVTRISLWKNKDSLIGKYVKVKYFEQGNYDAPRFPIFVGFRDKEDM